MLTTTSNCPPLMSMIKTDYIPKEAIARAVVELGGGALAVRKLARQLHVYCGQLDCISMSVLSSQGELP